MKICNGLSRLVAKSNPADSHNLQFVCSFHQGIFHSLPWPMLVRASYDCQVAQAVCRPAKQVVKTLLACWLSTLTAFNERLSGSRVRSLSSENGVVTLLLGTAGRLVVGVRVCPPKHGGPKPTRARIPKIRWPRVPECVLRKWSVIRVV
jgi:hypothetical protein